MANKISIDNQNSGGQAGINATRNSSMGWGTWDEKSRRNHIINTLIRVKPENTEELIREAFLIVPSALSDNIKFNIIGEDKWEDLDNGDYKYPHHEIEDDEVMIVKLRGLDACWNRLKRAGKLSGDSKEHLERHYKEFGATTPDEVEDKITENFDHIGSFVESSKTDVKMFELSTLPETFQKLIEEVIDLIIETMNVIIKRPKFDLLNKAAVIREIQKEFRKGWRKVILVRATESGKFKDGIIVITGAKQHWNFFDTVKGTPGKNDVYKTFYAMMQEIEKQIKSKINETSKYWGLEFVLLGDPIDQIHQFEFKIGSGVSEFLWNHIHKEDFIKESIETVEAVDTSDFLIFIRESLKELDPHTFVKEAKVMNQYYEDADDGFNPEDYWIEEVGGPPPGFEDDPSPQPAAPPQPEPKPVPHQKQPSLTSQRHAEESDKNGVRRKQLYIAFIEWAKSYNPKNTFGSLFQKDTFRITYPFIPDEMRYFYRLANPILCVLGGDLTFFSVEKLREANKNNAEKEKYLIFAATPNDLRVFNKTDKMIYRATKVKEQPGVTTPIELKENLGPDFDNYIQKMIGQGDILNTPLPEDDTPKTESVVMEKSEGRSLTPVERKIVEDRFGDSGRHVTFKFVPEKGYYAYTHRSKTDFYEDLYKMPKGKVAFVSSTS